MMLPAGRMAEPSILRSHPPTDERVARLDALKQTAQWADHGDRDRDRRPGRRMPTARRLSPVPKIPRAGRYEQESLRDWMSFASQRPTIAPVVGADEAERPCCARALCPPRDRAPRIRIMRGGVWW